MNNISNSLLFICYIMANDVPTMYAASLTLKVKVAHTPIVLILLERRWATTMTNS